MSEDLPNPESREELYLAKAAGESVEVPTPESRKELFLNAIAQGGGGGGGSYSAGTGIDITSNVISVDTNTIQAKLTAGTGIDITGNTISATGGGDTVYSDVQTSDSSTGGAIYIGNKNAQQQVIGDPTPNDYHLKYFVALPMYNPTSAENFQISILGECGGFGSIALDGRASGRSVSIGNESSAWTYERTVAIGNQATVNNRYGVALGSGAKTTRVGEVNVSGENQGYGGYNNTIYRLIGGVYDGQEAHDVATVGQINATIDAINTALSTNIPHIGAQS